MLTLFLVAIAVIWIIFAVVSDLRSREIPNWLNFSLIIFVLGIRFFYSVFNEDWSFFLWGLFGFSAFFLLANLLYFSRFFAGGDAKLMMALGPIIPLGASLFQNVKLSLGFLFLFLITGAIFGVVNIFYFSFKNFNTIKTDFVKNMKNRRRMFYAFMLFGLVLMILGLWEEIFFIFGVLLFILHSLLFYARAIDNNSLVQRINSNKLTEGDWLYQKVKVGKRFIEPTWDGLSKKDIELIKKNHKSVKIKIGIEFSPVFLISFLIFVYLYFYGIDLWNSFW